jgi:hypothetical protein
MAMFRATELDCGRARVETAIDAGDVKAAAEAKEERMIPAESFMLMIILYAIVCSINNNNNNVIDANSSVLIAWSQK